MDDHQKIEKELQSKGKTAPRLTPDLIESAIDDIEYVYPKILPTFTICVLRLKNGYIVTGESAPVSTANFDKDIGKDIALKKAKSKIWMLEGYLLRQAEFEKSEE